jgi:signal transduction histidine kinase
MSVEPVRLLLVEDDEDDYVLIRDILSEIPDWTVHLDWAGTFDRALERAATEQYDLCFLDYRLGERTGIELLEKLQTVASGTPVLMLTGRGDHNIDLEAMEKGAVDYLEKGNLTASLVERAIRYALDRARTMEALRAGERRLRALSSRILRAQEEERRRIAKELHDSVGGNLTAIKYALEDKLQRTRETGEPREGVPLRQIVDTVQETIEEIQRISSNLRPSVLDNMGLPAALQWTARKMGELHDGARILVDCDIPEDRIPENLKIVLLRVAQESLNNAVKHAGPNSVRIWLREETDRLVMEIEDDGRGFDPGAADPGKTSFGGIGLDGMKERVELSGGQLEVRSAPGKGTCLTARWPVAAAQP